MYHFGVLGVLGVPFWCTILVYLVYLVYHFGVPFWCTWCTATRETPLRITSQFPKNEPDSGNTPPDHHGTFEKSPTKTPAGPDGPALVSPNVQAGPHRRRQKIRWLHHTPAGTVIRPEAPNDHHTSMISNDGRTPNTTMTAAIQDRQHRSPPSGPNRAVLGHPIKPPTDNTAHPSEPNTPNTCLLYTSPSPRD